MAATSYTNGISGKKGKIVLDAGTLRLTSWSLPTRVDKVEITNSESPASTFNSVALVSGEYIPGVFDAELTFEGIYTVLENVTGPEYTGLFTGSKTIAPGFGSLPAAGMGAYATTLTPDRSQSAATFTGNVLVLTLEPAGKVREGTVYKGTGIFTGGLTGANT